MTMRRRALPLGVAALAAGLLLAGCGETTPSRFYTLSSVVAAPGEAGRRHRGT